MSGVHTDSLAMCTGVVRYAIRDSFSFTVNSPGNIQLAESSSSCIANLSFSTKAEGMQQFELVKKTLEAIQRKDTAALTPIAGEPSVRFPDADGHLIWADSQQCCCVGGVGTRSVLQDAVQCSEATL